MSNVTIIFLLISVLSVSLNIILLIYFRRVIGRIYAASEEVSEIFTRLDSFQEHLQSVYELPTFYGDDTLKGLLDHSKGILEYLSRYDEVYSFTQPDLLEQLSEATKGLEEEYDEEETPQEKE